MAVRSELQFRIPNSPGSLARITTLLAADQVRIVAFCLDSAGLVRMIVDNPAHAAETLARERVAVERRDIIYTLVAARSIAALLRGVAESGINVEYAYMSTLDVDGMVGLVLGVDDAQRASAAAGI